ncbi:hypothetical protein [Sodalis sp. C49]|uniref:hypothetical protein n=1 Tax=Sodalis sp. C49 TaxID=3228929 RepID=UPI003965A088
MAVHKAETVLFKEERANTKRKADVFKEMRAKGVESGVVFPPDRAPHGALGPPTPNLKQTCSRESVPMGSNRACFSRPTEAPWQAMPAITDAA